MAWRGASRQAPPAPRSAEALRAARAALPVAAHRDAFLALLRDHRVVVVVGATGSGKTTQLPQYAVEEGFRAVACTQPRRVAAITVSQRVAKEMGVGWGDAVGYAVRFDCKAGPRTRLRYMTDGLLLQECMSHPTFDQYDLLFLDEVHERTLATDLLLGLLKGAVAQPGGPKVVVMSATFDCVRFADFFSGAPTLDIPGRCYPVEVRYTQQPVQDYLEAMLTLVYHLLLFEPHGDILAFLTGEEEIERAVAVVREDPRFQPAAGAVALPLYAALPPEEQQKVFEPSIGARKVIFATNIAETSITIPSVVHVVDCGFSKQKVYLPGPQVETLLVQPISKAAAQQRAGRAGRTAPGWCYRLYSAAAFEALPEATVPEILRTHLSSVLLQLATLGVPNPLAFPFVEPPSTDILARSLDELRALGAVDPAFAITSLGRTLSHLPIAPPMAAALVQAHHEGCTQQVAGIVAMLSVPKLYFKSDREASDHADRAQALFRVRGSDHLQLLKIMNHYTKACTGDLNGALPPHVRDQGCPAGRAFCRRHKLNEKALLQACRIQHQLLRILEGHRVPCPSMPVYDFDQAEYSVAVRRALCRGLLTSLARLEDYDYVVPATGRHFQLHPSSCLKGTEPWVIFQEALITDRAYLHVCSAVEETWLREFGCPWLRR